MCGTIPNNMKKPNVRNDTLRVGDKNVREWKSSGKFWKVLESPFLTCKTREK